MNAKTRKELTPSDVANAVKRIVGKEAFESMGNLSDKQFRKLEDSITKPQHTPTPDLKTFVIMGTPEQKAYVRRAVNAHEELVSCLYAAINEIAEFHADSSDGEPCQLLIRLEKAIAKGEGRA